MTQLIHALARASEKYDKLALLLAGDGDQRDELLELSADLGVSDKVFFTGFIRGQKLRDTYTTSDVFVMSSVSEPCGITALEAAHHNTALIITKQSGVGEVLNSVLRYDFWDIDRLADQMVAVAVSNALLDSLRENVHHEYSRLSWRDVADACVSLYNRLAKKAVAA
jgi:glycosyltransferase involved in cell wall biosynthesis